MFLDLALESILGNKVRSGLTVLGIVLAIAAVITLGSITEGITSMLDDSLSGMSGLVVVTEKGSTDASSSGMGGEIPGMNSRIDENVLDEIRQISGVKTVASEVTGIDRATQTIISGMNFDDLQLFNLDELELSEGSWPEGGEGWSAVIGSHIAESRDLGVGDVMVFKGKEFSVEGILEETNGFFDFGTMVSTEGAQEALGMEGFVSAIDIEAEDLGYSESIAEEINEMYDDLDATTVDEQLKKAKEMIGGVSIFTFGIGVVASVVAAIGIINTMVMTVMKRRKQFGIMKALGATRSSILGIVLLEAGIMGILGGFLGLFLGILGTEALNTMYPFPIAKVTPILAFGALFFSIVLAILSALYPAYRAISVDPAEAMRDT